MRRCPACFLGAVLLVCGGVAAVRGAEAEGTLLVPRCAGQPGEEVILEWKVTLLTMVTDLSILFDVPSTDVRFVGATLEGTAAGHSPPQGVIFDPAFFQGGYRIGLRLDTTGRYQTIGPGEGITVVKGIFRIDADASPGEVPIKIRSFEGTAVSFPTPTSARVRSLPVAVEGDGTFRIDPPSGPRPVGGLSCGQLGTDVSLSWMNTEGYETISVERDGVTVASLDGAATGFVDAPLPGPASYEVIARRGAAESIPASCSLLVQVPRPPGVTAFACAASEGSVALQWTNGTAYDSITLYRSGKVIAELPGTSTSHVDPWASELFTVYSIRARAAGIDALPASCTLNATSDRYTMWAEDVRADPGAAGVSVRLFCTNPDEVRGIDVGLRVDPALASIRELSLSGTACQRAPADFFLYQRHVLDRGETRAGIGFDYTPPSGYPLPAGADQHFLTVILDVLPGASGAIPIQIGAFGEPSGDPIFVVRGRSQFAEISSGLVLVGPSPVPEVEGARAEAVDASPAGDGAGAADPAPAGSVRLLWSDPVLYSSIRIERDGALLAELDGGTTSHIDPAPGPGVHRYRIAGLQGGASSFPVVVTTLPAGVPGTFLRGDSDSSGAVQITDAVVLLRHLVGQGAQPSCLDAADADDNGRLNITDAVVILQHLFGGVRDLALPGVWTAWFDPTEDELGCD